jgi:hypothetical protein
MLMKKKYYWIIGIAIVVVLISIFIFGNLLDNLINGVINIQSSSCNSDSDCNLIYEYECYGCSVPKCMNGEYKGRFCMFTKHSFFGNLFSTVSCTAYTSEHSGPNYECRCNNGCKLEIK